MRCTSSFAYAVALIVFKGTKAVTEEDFSCSGLGFNTEADFARDVLLSTFKQEFLLNGRH